MGPVTSGRRPRGVSRVPLLVGLFIGAPLTAQPVTPESLDSVTVRAAAVRAPAGLTGGPVVRVGIAVDREAATLSSRAGLLLEDALTGQPAGEIGPGGRMRLSAAGPVLHVEGDFGETPRGVPSLRVYPARVEDALYVDGRPYRGVAEVRIAGPGRVNVINELSLEEYLLGVVPLEIGPREPEELAAVEAQAVAARTYAVSRLGAHAELGFDLYGSVEDQVYGGVDAERDESTSAVLRTAGQILMYDGRPIRAYYHSTCGGRTAAVEEVLDREPAPYLQAVTDRGPGGSDWCAASPKYRWNAVWSPAELDAISRAGLIAHFGASADAVGQVEELEVIGRTPSGRVRDLAFRGAGLELVLNRLDIRRVLAQDGRILNSTDFALADRVDGLVEVRGRGYGHGAGMCQWGAIGRARAGQSFEQILRAYYPGAVLVNVYEGAGG